MAKTHFAGGLKIGGTQYLRGWACCCTGRRAEAIRLHGEWTFEQAHVTCGNCLSVLRRAAANHFTEVKRSTTDNGGYEHAQLPQ